MDSQQKVFVLKTTMKKTEGLDELNTHLSRGWRVVAVEPMGGAGAGSHEASALVQLGAVVVVERSTTSRSEVLEESAEQSEELIDEISDGNGAGLDIENGSEKGEEPSSEEESTPPGQESSSEN